MQSAMCEKCQKRPTCRKPCRPVELYLRENNLTAFQKNAIGKNGEKIRVAMPRSRETQRSCMSGGLDDPRLSTKEAQAFSSESENPFQHYEPRKKQTSVFIKRFFFKWSYEDISVAHDISIDAARKIYHAGVQKLLSVIIEMDAVHKMTETERKKSGVKRSMKYYEKNKEQIKAKRRARYAAKKKAGRD